MLISRFSSNNIFFRLLCDQNYSIYCQAKTRCINKYYTPSVVVSILVKLYYILVKYLRSRVYKYNNIIQVKRLRSGVTSA